MISRNQQLKLLARVRAQRERQIAARAAAAKSATGRQRQQLEELEDWRAGYRQQGPTDQKATPVTAAGLIRWRQFVSGIDNVITQQRETLAENEASLAAIVDDLRQAVVATEVVETLCVQSEDEERLFDLQSEQEEQDDRVGHGTGRKEQR